VPGAACVRAKVFKSSYTILGEFGYKRADHRALTCKYHQGISQSFEASRCGEFILASYLKAESKGEAIRYDDNASGM